MIIEAIFNELENLNEGKEVIENFVESISEIKIPGMGISLENKQEFIRDVRNKFSDFLLSIVNCLNDYNGLFLIVDDINGLSKTPEFPNWYKRLAETIDFGDEKFPIVFALVSCRENFDKLTEHNPSFSRIFHYIEINI
ncbi:MAG: hypothetical protein IJ672_08235 [Methanobrevibacter sp.]|nr:hypothetical protein [Methanobrevibacter sp.]MBR1611449.1 hypothetical protein [Methanobrevibacter sp.]